MPYSFNPLSGLGLDQSIPLDGAGKIPSDYLPSYVDDVVEYANLAGFPETGETGKIYVAIDTGFTYRWSGSVYIQINSLTGTFAANAGTAAAPSISIGTADNGLYAPAEDEVAISTNGTGRLFIDSSGRLLVGTSSSSSSATIESKLQVEGTDASASLAMKRHTASNAPPYLVLAKSRGGAGNVDIIQDDDRLGEIFFAGADGVDLNSQGASIKAEVDGTPGANDMPGRLVFSTTAATASSPTERMRITSGGGFKVSDTGSYTLSASDANHEFNRNTAGSAALHVYHTASSGTPYGIYCQFTQQNPNDATSYVFTSLDNNSTNIYTIFSNGSVSARSDGRLKKNIETTRDGYLEDLSRLRVVKYNWLNHEDNTPKELGFIAQEVEEVFPGLVQTTPNKDSEGNETGDTTKSIKTSVFTPMLVKALQEALERIETLEQRLNDAGIA